jgi:Flagellar hook-length control protein FliK
MKISNESPPAADSDMNSHDADTPNNEQQNEPSPFSRVLAKKQALEDEQGGQGNSRRVGEPDGTITGIMPNPSLFDRPFVASKTDSKHIVALPVELQSLVREISVVSGGHEVHIEMNSNALRGLHIRIEKQDGAVAIQFQSSSEDTARLLSRNLDSLSQSLADRGVSVADIRVTTVAATAKKWSQKPGSQSGSNSGGRSQSGREGKR